MKIAQVTSTFPPYMSGTGTASYFYALELAKLGNDVTVFTSNYPNISYTYPSIIKVLRFNYFFKFGNAPFIPQLFGIKKYDVIHLQYPFFFGAELVYIISKIRRIPYVISYHNDTYANGFKGIYFKIYRKTIMKMIFNDASKIFTSSLDYAEHSFLNYLLDKRENKVIEIPYGVDTAIFDSKINSDEVKQKYDLNDKKIILFVGGLDRPHFFKGLEYLLTAFQRVNDKNLRLLIIGDGDLKEHYQQLTQLNGIESQVIFVGNVTNEDMPKYYSACDLFVLPSITMGESFGIVLIEAMAMGKPVIASNLPGVRTVVDDGYNGFLVEPKDIDMLASKIKQVLYDPDMCAMLGNNGLKKVKEVYTWDSIGKRLNNEIRSIL